MTKSCFTAAVRVLPKAASDTISPAFKLAPSIGLRKTKAARCKPSYATNGTENQNAAFKFDKS